MSNVYRKVKFLLDFYPIPELRFETEALIAETVLPGEEQDPASTSFPEPLPDIEDVNKQALDILSEANKKKEEILEEAGDEAERLKETALQQGFEEGRKQGIQSGKESLHQEISNHRQTFLNLINSIHEEKKKILEESEGEIVDLAYEIARTIVKEEILLNKEICVKMAREAVSRLARKENLVVRVHPDDLETLNLHRDDLLREQDLEDLRIIPDPRVDSGGCIVDSSGGQVDARIETQFGEVKKALTRLKLEGRKKPSAAHGH